MRCIIDATPVDFLTNTVDFRTADPIITNVITTLVVSQAEGHLPVEPGALWLRIESAAGETVGIALRTPPRGVLLSNMPSEVARFAAESLAELAIELPETNGPIEAAHAFTQQYCALIGMSFVATLDQRMLALRQVIPGRPTAGTRRGATAADRDTIVEWMQGFNRDIGHSVPPDAAQIERRIATPGIISLWEVDGRPTSLCWQSVPAAGVVRISAVYTPPGERGHGYASANVAAVSQHALDLGADACMLYTDRTNPTSNKIYEAIGYEWIADCMLYKLTAAAGLPGSAPAS